MATTNRLRVLRAERRISQMDLSALAGIKENRYWRIENGYVDPTDTEQALLAEALQTTPSELFPAPSTEAAQ